VPEQTLDESAENHRVGDVGHEELIEADHTRALRQALRHDLERLLAARGITHFGVHLAHEAIEVTSFAPLRAQRVVEPIHQQRLAAADSAPEVQAALRRPRRGARQPAESRPQFVRDSILPESRAQSIQSRGRLSLPLIELKPTSGNLVAQPHRDRRKFLDRHRHVPWADIIMNDRMLERTPGSGRAQWIYGGRGNPFLTPAAEREIHCRSWMKTATNSGSWAPNPLPASPT
jgi:hypothetical protein